jgi:hypothetical protein
MKRFVMLYGLVLGLALIWGCGDNDSSSSDSEIETGGDGAAYAKYGKALSDAIPAGLKSGASSSTLGVHLQGLLGECASSYTNCPYITASGGGDSDTGEILMRLWGIDYNSECTDAYLADGTCFNCADCMMGGETTGVNFIMPTMLSDPESCATTSSISGRYVNLGVDPCFFDTKIAEIDNISECEASEGAAVDISSVVPWYAAWGIPQNVYFSSYYATDDGGIWWTVNNGDNGNKQYFISLDANWLYGGIKDPDEDYFIFFGTGSPAYFGGIGEDGGINISAYSGTLSETPASFEAIQVRDQGSNTYIERLKSNGSHVWYQKWNDSPATPAAVEAVKNSPNTNKCVEIGDSVATSKYVPFSDCSSSFDVADTDALNADGGFKLKLIDMTTANSIDFSTPLTENSVSTCLEEVEGAG